MLARSVVKGISQQLCRMHPFGIRKARFVRQLSSSGRAVHRAAFAVSKRRILLASHQAHRRNCETEIETAS